VIDIIKTSDFQHLAAAHFYRSWGTRFVPRHTGWEALT